MSLVFCDFTCRRCKRFRRGQHEPALQHNMPIKAQTSDTEKQEYRKGSRDEFLSDLKSDKYSSVVAIYRSNDSTKVTGPFDAELIKQLPSSVKFITHNGAGRAIPYMKSQSQD